MKLIKIIAILAVLFVVGGFVLPADYDITRTALISGEKSLIHEYVGDLDKWHEWTPWEKADPSLIVYPGDSSSGMGASQSWTGSSGSGSLVITETSVDDGIKYDLVLNDVDKAKAVISYRGLGDMTEVTWTMTGNMDNTMILGPYLAITMDIAVGHMFEEGLENLQKVVEDQNY